MMSVKGPSVPLVCLDDFEQYAERVLSKSAMDYYRSGADDEITVQDNVEAFKRYRMMPRMLIDVAKMDTTTTILGHPLSFPVCVGPSAIHGLAHPDGEIATARGTAAVKICFTLSTMSTRSIEEVAGATPDSLRFFQIYFSRSRDVTASMIKRAEANGYKAVVMTVDIPFSGKRRNDIRNNFSVPSHLRMANFGDDGTRDKSLDEAYYKYVSGQLDDRVTWDDLTWLKSITPLPIVVKGILTASDAVKALERGVAGIIVSNHGGRQLDSTPATIDMLAEVVQAVAGRCEVYLDGGVRTGTAIFKALALGARAVFIARPAIYALAYNGASGVEEMLKILKDEFYSAMALSGCAKVSDITSDFIDTQHSLQRLQKTSKL